MAVTRKEFEDFIKKNKDGLYIKLPTTKKSGFKKTQYKGNIPQEGWAFNFPSNTDINGIIIDYKAPLKEYDNGGYMGFTTDYKDNNEIIITIKKPESVIINPDHDDFFDVDLWPEK
jgi:hypothetical protein